MTDSQPLDYDDVKALSARLGRPASALVALSKTRDPFFVSPARVRAAEWFADIFEAYAPVGRVHLRRLHYWAVNLPAAQRPAMLNGAPYENSHACWRALSGASVDARTLGLVDADAFDDRRNGAPPFLFEPDDEDEAAMVTTLGAEVPEPSQEGPPFSPYTPSSDVFPDLPEGYDVDAPSIAEPYAIEIWVEKSTVNDILLPIARRHGVTVVSGLGELSLTLVDRLIERVGEHGRKTRIFYISDYDPAGVNMPCSIARKIELYIRRDDLDLDIRLHPLVMTSDQIERYDLPRIPIKDTESRKGKFEERFGEGGVELDALEAIHPGELARIVSEAIAVYRQPAERVREEIESAAADFQADCAEVRDQVLAAHAEPLARLRAEFSTLRAEISEHQQTLREISDEIAERYQERIDEAVSAIEELRQQFAERAEEVFSAINTDLEAAAPDPDEVDWPTAADAVADEDDDALFDSARGYLEQMTFYKDHQRKPTTGRPAGRRGNGNGGAR
jgi:hypothetical protein